MKFLFLHLSDSTNPHLIVWPSDRAPLPDIILDNIAQVKVFDSMDDVNEYVYTHISGNDRYKMHASNGIVPGKHYC